MIRNKIPYSILIGWYVDFYIDLFNTIKNLRIKKDDGINNVVNSTIETFTHTKVTNETNFYSDLNFDEFDFLALVGDIEKKLGIYLPDHHLEKVKTVGDLVNLINKIYFNYK